MDKPIDEGQPTKPGDRRRDLRAPLIIQKIKMGEGTKTFFGYAKNISKSGMFISTSNPKETGQKFQIEIPLPYPINQTAQCTCEVVWSRQYVKKSPLDPGMGLKFLDLPEELASAIDEWVKSEKEKV